MSELKEIELKEAYITSESYPILWVGENGYNITRYGKLIVTKPSYYEDKEQMNLIISTLKLHQKHIPFNPDRLYIIAGGISQKLVYVMDVIEICRGEKITLSELGFPANAKYELASGLKQKTIGVIYSDNFSLNLFEKLEIPEGRSIVGKLYPDTFKVFKQSGKLYIKYIQPEDC